MHFFEGNKLALTGFIIILILFFVAATAEWIAPYDPAAIDVKKILLPPSFEHFFGTDDLGRDVFSRVIYGASVSLSVGFIAVSISTLIGLLLGVISGYYGGWVDSSIMRLVDLMLCIPTFFLLLSVITFVGPGLTNIMIIIGLTSWMGVTRLVRAEILSLKGREFILSAQAIGSRDKRIIFKHLLPNAMAPVVVSAVLGVGQAILIESGLSFLGLGIQPPEASWGNILTAGKDNIELAWWLSFFPGLAILLTVLSYNLVGENIRDFFDPRLRQ
ncbi:MAG: ABC transporter permease [Nitrospinae bacterium]|nr:ABC transporter permease [Nitrospinota bacterium]